MSAGPFNVAINDLLHFMSIKWLGDVIVSAKSESFLGGFKRPKTGEHDDRKMRIDFANLTQTLNAAYSRHPNIHDDGIGLFLFEEFEAGLDAIGSVHLIIWFQKHAQAFARPHFVINDENLRLVGSNGGSGGGEIMSKA